jgi:hypothetical protein
MMSRPSGSASRSPSDFAPAASILPPVSSGSRRHEDVVLAAGVDADHGPHQMIVRHDRHARPPDDVEDRQIRSVIELLHLGPPRLAKPGDDAGRIGNRPRDDFAHRFVGRVFAHRGAAILDKAIEIEHSPPPSLTLASRRKPGPIFPPLDRPIHGSRPAPGTN